MLPHSISLENLWQIHQLECVYECDVFVTNHRVEDNVLWVKLSTHVGNLLNMLYSSHAWKLSTSLCVYIRLTLGLRETMYDVPCMYTQECYFYFRVSLSLMDDKVVFLFDVSIISCNHILKLKEKIKLKFPFKCSAYTCHKHNMFVRYYNM